MTPSVRTYLLPFENVLVREMMKPHYGIESCHPTDFSEVAPIVHHSMKCEQQSMLHFAFHQQVLLRVSLYAHFSPNLHPAGALNCVLSETSQKIK